MGGIIIVHISGDSLLYLLKDLDVYLVMRIPNSGCVVDTFTCPALSMSTVVLFYYKGTTLAKLCTREYVVEHWSENCGVFTSFMHCLKFCPRNQRVRFAFPATSEVCLDHVRSSDTLMFRYLLASVTSRTWLQSVYVDWKALFFFLPEVMQMTEHFDRLKLICYAHSYSSSAERSS